MVANSDAARLITDARAAASAEQSSRIRRYALAMAFRTACFIGLFFVDGYARWALLAAAIVLPYIAVLLANQTDTKGSQHKVATGAPADARQLTVGPDDAVVTGEVVLDEQGGAHTAHHTPGRRGSSHHTPTHHDVPAQEWHGSHRAGEQQDRVA